jgi:hypothetical protein
VTFADRQASPAELHGYADVGKSPALNQCATRRQVADSHGRRRADGVKRRDDEQILAILEAALGICNEGQHRRELTRS